MKKLTAGISLIAALAATLTFAACAPIVTTRGNLISPNKFEQVHVNTSTRADVIQIWGPPTTMSTFDPNVWYYIGETTAQKGIFPAEVQKRRMIRVKFDPANNDIVTDIADLDPRQARDIAFVSRTTPSAGKEFTAVQQFIGNLGKYNANVDKK